ncbi:DUF6491 family protein [Luteimonas suaedae]|uniref:DUF6491 family protein n=1 Tax=Luteimonas suaedae TaxID=2605430 RepID=UPI0011EFA438|nr:DUF6491 family protein [Luteimonas suaedae]
MKRMSLLLGSILALGACASTDRLTDSQRVETYRANAGEPVRDFRFFGNLNGWTPLGDRALVVWTRPNEAYLLELAGRCQDLDFAPAISLTNFSGRVSARFDDVIVRGGGSDTGRIPCRIQEIRPVDVKAVKVAEQELREANVEERQRSPEQD